MKRIRGKLTNAEMDFQKPPADSQSRHISVFSSSLGNMGSLHTDGTRVLGSRAAAGAPLTRPGNPDYLVVPLEATLSVDGIVNTVPSPCWPRLTGSLEFMILHSFNQPGSCGPQPFRNWPSPASGALSWERLLKVKAREAVILFYFILFVLFCFKYTVC